MRIPILSYLPEGYLDELIREHCGELMERFYPERCRWAKVRRANGHCSQPTATIAERETFSLPT
jgi:hypothetical protein